MKILQINIRVNKGSVSRITEQIGLKVIEQGWESYIAFGRPSNPSKSRLLPIGSYNGVKWHYILSQITGHHGLFSKKATAKFVETIKEINPDVIHLQNIHGYYLNYKVLFEFLNSTTIPVVWTLHDCWSFTGHCAHFVTVGCDKWKTNCYECPLKRAYPRSLFFDQSKKDYLLKKELFTSNQSLHFVTVSKWLGSLVWQSFFKNFDIRIIYNGIDLNVFYPRMIGKSSDNNDIGALYNKLSGNGKRFIILGCATTWNAAKGLFDYVRLSRELSNDYQIVLVGVSEKTKKQLPSNIIALPRTYSVDKLAWLYSIADVVTSLSYAETFGLTIVEGMACGTPAIAYDNTAQPELIDDDCGIVVPTGDIDALKQALAEIKSKTKGFYSESCIRRARTLFNKDARYNDYINLYKELCSQKS